MNYVIRFVADRAVKVVIKRELRFSISCKLIGTGRERFECLGHYLVHLLV